MQLRAYTFSRSLDVQGLNNSKRELYMRKVMSMLGIATLIALAPGVVLAQEQAQQPAAAAADPDADKVVCKKVDTTGSRLSKEKVCKTRAEWLDVRRRDKDDEDHLERTDMANKIGMKGLDARQ